MKQSDSQRATHGTNIHLKRKKNKTPSPQWKPQLRIIRPFQNKTLPDARVSVRTRQLRTRSRSIALLALRRRRSDIERHQLVYRLIGPQLDGR